MSQKAITNIDELEKYLSEKDLENLVYARQVLIPSVEALVVSLFAEYLKKRGTIKKLIGATYVGDMFTSFNSDKAAIVSGTGILIYPRNEETKLLSYSYEMTKASKWENKRIREIECEYKSIKPFRDNNPLNFVECENKKIIDFWENVTNNLKYFLRFDEIVDFTQKANGKRSKDYYQKEYPEFVEKDNRAILIENFEVAENLEKLYGGRYIFLAVNKKESFGKFPVGYNSLVTPSQELEEKIRVAIENAIKSVENDYEKNIIQLQRKLYESFVREVTNNK